MALKTCPNCGDHYDDSEPHRCTAFPFLRYAAEATVFAVAFALSVIL